jgi:hypothetical protein
VRIHFEVKDTGLPRGFISIQILALTACLFRGLAGALAPAGAQDEQEPEPPV